MKYIREKCLCCECKYYMPPVNNNYIGIEYTTYGTNERCKKGELAIGNRKSKGICKYFKESD